MDYTETIPVTDRVAAPARPAAVVSAREVNTEGFRRIDARYPPQARDFLIIEGLALLFKGQANWNAADTTRAQSIQAMRTSYKAHIDAATTLKAMSPIPLDYAANQYWPA
jgi:hypothetical protein